MITLIPTTTKLPFLVWYIIVRGAKDCNQDMLDQAALLCSSIGAGCSGCFMVDACQRLFDKRTDRNIERW